MGNSSQSRKWNLVINSPQECGLDHSAIAEKLQMFSPAYFCMADEIATTGTYHTHIFLYSTSPMRFSTVKKRFPTAHIEKAYGSVRENRDYIRKEGKWAETDKAETKVPDSFLEWGNMPTEREEKAPQMCKLIQDLRDKVSTADIIQESPNLCFRARDIDILRQTLLSDQYTSENRKVEVWYIFGASGTGKTRGIYERHEPKQICRITNFRNRRGVYFDSYVGQDVLVFEEFHSQIPIGDMLNYLDVYPLTLPARYSDRVACYTRVYITSNIPLEKQYRDVQLDSMETWRAFLRRIHKVLEYRKDGSIIEYGTDGSVLEIIYEGTVENEKS